MDTQRCRACGRKVIFAPDVHGVTQVLDAVAPTYRVYASGSGRLECVRDDAHVSHFATCPQASPFSRHGRSAAEPRFGEEPDEMPAETAPPPEAPTCARLGLDLKALVATAEQLGLADLLVLLNQALVEVEARAEEERAELGGSV